jgi:hypothetical protein
MDTYHQKYSLLPDTEIQNRIDEKKEELEIIFSKIPFRANDAIIKIAVMGCGDKRFVRGHNEIFSELLQKPIEITTFDITIDHLIGEERVIKHDCTLSIPDGPYHITYGHVLLRFIETQKQWEVINNSYKALVPGGMAIHVMDKQDYETKEINLANGLYSVPVGKWIELLKKERIKYQLVPLKYGQALVIEK